MSPALRAGPAPKHRRKTTIANLVSAPHHPLGEEPKQELIEQ